MAKAIFKYPLGTILKLPGFNDAPGKIRSRIEHDDRPAEYFLEGIPGPRRAPSDYFTEGQLTEANPPLDLPPAAVIVAVRKRKKGR